MLLDALTALQPHIGAIVLIGAQAVYLRTAGRLSTYQPFTTDADLALDPALLADLPLLGDAMLDAGFELTAEPGIWQQRFQRPGFDGDITVPVDLIVPAELVSKAGRRGARLPGEHGKTAARKSEGVAGAIVDFDPFEVTSFEDDDDRVAVVNVAGPAALHDFSPTNDHRRLPAQRSFLYDNSLPRRAALASTSPCRPSPGSSTQPLSALC